MQAYHLHGMHLVSGTLTLDWDISSPPLPSAAFVSSSGAALPAWLASADAAGADEAPKVKADPMAGVKGAAEEFSCEEDARAGLLASACCHALPPDGAGNLNESGADADGALMEGAAEAAGMPLPNVRLDVCVPDELAKAAG